MAEAEAYRILARADDFPRDLRESLGEGVHIAFAAPAGSDAAWATAGGNDADPEAVVLGPAAKQPLAAAREARERWPGCQVVFLLPGDRLERFRASLPFVPHLADAWTADSAGPPDAVRAAILEAARTARRRRATASVFERINRQLGPAAAESAEAQRRRRQLALSERYLATLLTHAPDAIFAIDPEGAVIAWNDAASRLFGLSPDAAIGRPAVRLFADAARHEVEDLLARARAGEVIAQHEVLIAPAGGGSALHAELSLAPVREDDRRVASVSATARDITDRKRSADELRRLNETLEERVARAIAERETAEEQLRQAQKMEVVGQLTGGVAHDFNNLLTAISGNLELLAIRLPPGEETGRRMLNAALRGTERAAALTQRLLAFSRRQALQPRPIDLNKLVAGLSELLRRTLGEATVIETVLAGGLWPTLADPNQLENALLNLAVNARDAMPEGGKLTIETANAHLDEAYAARNSEVESGQYVMLAVTDTGTGMSEETLRKAFEPFYTTKDVGKGSGLGLSQVYGFVKQSNGHVKLYSEPGQGTTVKVYLPRHRGPVGAVAAADPRSGGPTHAGGGQLILVVEDDDDVREYTVAALDRLGYRMLEARDAEAALRHLEGRSDIALLFTDVVLPGMNGRLLADEARRRRPDLKVLFTTGYTRNAIVHNGTLDPGVDIIGKPFTLQGLAAKLREVMKGSG